MLVAIRASRILDQAYGVVQIEAGRTGWRLPAAKPGKTATMSVTITPSGHRGDVVHGTLYVDEFSNFLTFGNELLAIPHAYSAGQRTTE